MGQRYSGGRGRRQWCKGRGRGEDLEFVVLILGAVLAARDKWLYAKDT